MALANEKNGSRDLVLRVGGDSAAGGIVATGEIFAYMAAFAGLEVFTTRTIPAEIKGGHVMYQMRAALEPLVAQGDQLDVLLAYDEETYERYHPLLKPGGVLVYNSDDLSLTAGDHHRQIGIPMHGIAKSLSFAKGYNMVAVGALVKLFDLDMQLARKAVEKRFGRRADILPVNLAALEKGYQFIEQNVTREAPFHLPVPSEPRAERLVLSGNQAISIGIIAANCRFFAGYPITPASEIMEYLAVEFPKVGGTVVQAEDEIAACGMALGASFTGVRALTATSGPGFALMIEMLSHASMTETPLVIVDVQRAGPSTGMPTKVSQGDLRLACYGGNDDAPRIVLAATTVADCFYLMIHAFNLADKYQTPVVFLSDQDMAVRVQTIPPFDLSKVFHEPRVLYDPSADGRGPYERYRDTDSGVSPMSLPGQPGGQYTAEGLEHYASGAPVFSVEQHTANMRKRARKLESALEYIEQHQLWETLGDPGAALGIIGWGSTIGPVREAIERCADDGIAVQAFYPKSLLPLPERPLAAFLENKRTVIVPEMNFSGQLADILQARFLRPFVKFNRYGGVPFETRELVAAIRDEYAKMR